MLDAAYLIVGLLVLVKSADWLVIGASDLAQRFNVSPLVIGLTIVSFGTSMPELVVTLLSGLAHKPDLAIGNVIGSNICNVLLVLGVAAIVQPLKVRDSTLVSEIPFSLTAAVLVGFLANAALFTKNPDLTISQLDGVILLGFFLLFMLYVYKVSRNSHYFDGQETKKQTRFRDTFFLIAGIVGLYFGGEWVVTGAVGLAQTWGVDDAMIGLTIVAIGTSSPELFASVVAAMRGETDIAVGNVVGSNIFNLLWILGLTATVVELPFEVVSNTDLIMVICASVMILLAMVTTKKRAVLRWHGVLFVSLYSAYLTYVVTRV